MLELLRNQNWSRKFGLYFAAILLSVGVLILYGKATRHSDIPRFTGDDDMRLMQRTRVKCPAPGPDTLVLVGIGQSNAGNWGEPVGSTSRANSDVFEFWQGNCYQAASPMLGATGGASSLWPELGRSIVESGVAKQVVFLVFSVDGAPIKRFVARDDLWPLWRAQLKLLLEIFPVDYYMWLQGEADFSRGTTSEEYKRLFADLYSSIKEVDRGALVYIPIQSYCAQTERWTPQNEISIAQAAIPVAMQGTLAGVDSDAILSEAGTRWDGCHPSSRGYAIWAKAWASRIAKERAKSFEAGVSR